MLGVNRKDVADFIVSENCFRQQKTAISKNKEIGYFRFAVVISRGTDSHICLIIMGGTQSELKLQEDNEYTN